MIRSSVDLPQPLGPITETKSPCATDRLMPSSAGMPITSFFTGLKNVLWMFSTDSLGAVIGSVGGGRTCRENTTRHARRVPALSLEHVAQIIATFPGGDVVPAVIAQILVDEARIYHLVQGHHRIDGLFLNHRFHVLDEDLGIHTAVGINDQRIRFRAE